MGADGANSRCCRRRRRAEADSTGDELTAKLRAMVKAWHADAARLAGAAALLQPGAPREGRAAVAA